MTYSWLLSNSGTLRFAPNCLFNCLAFVGWTVVSKSAERVNVVASQHVEANDTAAGAGAGAGWDLTFFFFVAAGCVINLVSSYAREYYTRREFVFTLRVRHTRDKSARFLFQMLRTRNM